MPKKKENRVTVRLNDEHHYLIERAAEHQGLSIAAYMRSCAVRDAKRQLGATPLEATDG